MTVRRTLSILAPGSAVAAPIPPVAASFLRSPDGQLQDFNVQRGGLALPTFPMAINNGGTITGNFSHGPDMNHVFSGVFRDGAGQTDGFIRLP